MKAYVKPAIIIEQAIIFETAHSDWHGGVSTNSHGHYYPNEPNGTGKGHYGCWPNNPGNYNNN